MKDLLKFILDNITKPDQFSIEESEENGKVTLLVNAAPQYLGLIIGKGGNTVKAIQTILRVRGRIENKFVQISVAKSKSD